MSVNLFNITRQIAQMNKVVNVAEQIKTINKVNQLIDKVTEPKSLPVVVPTVYATNLIATTEVSKLFLGLNWKQWLWIGGLTFVGGVGWYLYNKNIKEEDDI